MGAEEAAAAEAAADAAWDQGMKEYAELQKWLLFRTWRFGLLFSGYLLLAASGEASRRELHGCLRGVYVLPGSVGAAGCLHVWCALVHDASLAPQPPDGSCSLFCRQHFASSLARQSAMDTSSGSSQMSASCSRGTASQ